MENENNISGRKRRKKKKVGPVRIFFRILLFLLLVAAICYGIWFAVNYNKHKEVAEEAHYDPLSATALGIDPEKLRQMGRVNILVLGESGVGDGYNLTDTIMVVSYNPQTQQASMLSIPRDTYVGRKDRENGSTNYIASYKMNCMYRNGENIPQTVEKVEELTGLNIDYYILVNTDAIIQIVDAIGGVMFNVPIDMDYDDDSQDLYIHLQAGEQLIDGPKAEQLLRFRHNNDYSSYPSDYGDNDIGRMKTQRDFIKETLNQLIRFENITKLFDVINITFQNIQSDMPMEEMKYYIPYIFKFNMENILTDVLPGVSEKCNGVWIYVADEEDTEIVVEELFSDATPVPLDANAIEGTEAESANTINNKDVRIELLNGTGSQSEFEKAKEKLENAGYTISKMGNTTVTETSSMTNRTLKTKTIEDNLKKLLGIEKVNSTSSNPDIDFTIIIGKDFK